MNEFTQGQIDKYCEAVLTGCKPCALFPLQDRYVAEAIKIINEKSLLSHTEFLYKDWTTVWVYKKPFMLEIIRKTLTLFPPEQPQTAFDHWVLGKLFGYSDEAIEGFINLRRIFPDIKHNIRKQQQTCKVCGHADHFNFNLPDKLWQKIVPKKYQNRVVCLPCFDFFAFHKKINYAKDIKSFYFAGLKASIEFDIKGAVNL